MSSPSLSAPKTDAAATEVLTRLRDTLGAAAVLIGAEVPQRNRND